MEIMLYDKVWGTFIREDGTIAEASLGQCSYAAVDEINGLCLKHKDCHVEILIIHGISGFKTQAAAERCLNDLIELFPSAKNPHVVRYDENDYGCLSQEDIIEFDSFNVRGKDLKDELIKIRDYCDKEYHYYK